MKGESFVYSTSLNVLIVYTRRTGEVKKGGEFSLDGHL